MLCYTVKYLGKNCAEGEIKRLHVGYKTPLLQDKLKISSEISLETLKCSTILQVRVTRIFYAHKLLLQSGQSGA